jgi:hypothetical protein
MPPQLAHYRHLTHGRVFGPVEGRFRELREHHRQTGHNPKTSNGRVGDNLPGTRNLTFHLGWMSDLACYRQLRHRP